jgi:hypothetical protein
MKVKELIKKLKTLDQSAEVMVDGCQDGTVELDVENISEGYVVEEPVDYCGTHSNIMNLGDITEYEPDKVPIKIVLLGRA